MKFGIICGAIGIGAGAWVLFVEQDLSGLIGLITGAVVVAVAIASRRAIA